RLFGNDFWKNDVFVWVRKFQPISVEARRVGRIDVAAAGLISLDGLIGGRECDGLDLHVMGTEIIREIELGGRALPDTNRRAGELERRSHLQRLADHETLPVVIVDAGKDQSQAAVARTGPTRIPNEDVDLAGLQCSEPVLRRQRNEFDLFSIVEDRGREGAADVDVDPGPVALRVRKAKAGQLTVRAANEVAALLDRLQGLSGSGLSQQRCCDRKKNEQTFHVRLLLCKFGRWPSRGRKNSFNAMSAPGSEY